MDYSKRDIKQMMVVYTMANICIFILLVTLFYINTKQVKKGTSEEFNEVALSAEIENVDVVASNKVLFIDDYQGERDISMEEIFKDLIIGRYKISEKIEFNFGLNGVYSGFFDNSNKNVSGYRYDIIVINEVPLLNIYNKEKTAMVSYELILSGTSDIIIYYPKTELKIKLNN